MGEGAGYKDPLEKHRGVRTGRAGADAFLQDQRDDSYPCAYTAILINGTALQGEKQMVLRDLTARGHASGRW